MNKLFSVAAISVAAMLFARPTFALTQDEIITLCESGSAEDIKVALIRGELVKETLIDYTTEDYDGSEVTLTMSPLFIAAMKNPSGEAIKELVKVEPSLNGLSNAEKGFVNSVHTLVEDHQDFTQSERPLFTVTSHLAENRYTPLMIAARFNPSVDAIRALIDLGSDVNHARLKMVPGKTQDVFTGYDFNRTVNDMFFQEASLYTKDIGLGSGLTPLLLAVRFNPNPDIVKLLLARGADPNYHVNCSSVTPLSWAAAFNENEEVIDALLQNRANLTTDYSDGYKDGKNTKTFFQPIIYSMMNPNFEMFKKLVLHGADWNDKETTSVDGITPLMFASIACSNPEIVRYLISKGADVKARSDGGFTALTFAAQNESCPEVIQILIDAGAEVDAVDNYDRTPVFYAAGINTNPEAIEIFAKNGADLNAKSTYDKQHSHRVSAEDTPIAYAASFNPSGEVMASLIKHGATVNFRYGNNNATPLMWACARNNVDVVKALIAGKAKINIEDRDKNTTLFYALQNNEDPEVIRALVDGSADVKSPSTKGWYPFQIAARDAKNVYVLQALLDAGADPKAIGNKKPAAFYLKKNSEIEESIKNDEAAKALYYDLLKKLQ